MRPNVVSRPDSMSNYWLLRLANNDKVILQFAEAEMTVMAHGVFELLNEPRLMP